MSKRTNSASRDLLILASEVRSSTRDRLNEQAGEAQLCRLPPTRATPIY